MTKEELLELIISWENLPYIIDEIIREPQNIAALREIALHSNHPKSWRAAWIMDKIHEKSPGVITPIIPEIVEQVKIETQNGKKRHFLKLLSLNELPNKQLVVMLEFCIGLFTSAKEDLAVRVHAMQILYNITEKEPDLKPEILSLIENEMILHSSAGIISRGRKLVQKLRVQTG